MNNAQLQRLLSIIFACSLTIAVTAALARATPPGSADLINRGRYLVENVGLCSDCHTPHNEKGELVRERLLLGAPLPFQPLVPMPWSPVAPPIAGLPSMTESQAKAFFQTGKRPDGTTARPPMPEFRFNADDAAAVTAYLRSLKE